MDNEVKPIKNKPRILSIQVLPGKVVELKWSDAVGAQHYLIKRYDMVNGEFEGKVIDTLTNEFNTYRDTTIEEDGEYMYRVTARRKLPNKEKVYTHSAKTPVSIVSVEAPELKNICNEGKGIKISWDEDPDVDRYVVMRRFSFMNKAYPVAELEPGENSYVDDNFAEGQLMYYCIQSIYKKNSSLLYSKPSNELCSVILPQVKVMKTRKKLGKKVYFSLRLTAGADGYILYRKDGKDSENKEIMRTSSISSLLLGDTTPKSKGDTIYTVAAYKKSEEGQEFIGPKSEEIVFNF